MRKPLDELYFTWLYSQVADLEERSPSRTYWKLLRQLYNTDFEEFVPILRMDKNRADDGKELRIEFVRLKHVRDPDPTWMDLGCSMLELMMGLSRRLSFEAEGKPHYWFWKLVENLGLIKCNDAGYYPREHVDRVLRDVIRRRYEPNGRGGFFPLSHPDKDQRTVELWYQLCAYVLELG